MAQQATTRRATTKRRNARQARSRRESPLSVAAVCGRKGSWPSVTRRGGAGVSFSSARRQNVNFFVGSRGFSAAMVPCGGGCVLYGPSAAREAASAACAGSLRLRTPFSVVRCLSGRHPGSWHGFGKEAHETVSWEKAARRRSSQVVVALFLPIKSLYCSSGTAPLSSVYHLGLSAAHTKSMQSAALKQAFL